MSRIGKNPVEVPKGVTVALAGRTITAKGKLGELKLDLSNEVDATVEGDQITVKPRSTSKQSRTMWGTTRALLNNMVHGVSAGFTRRLEINGVGYRITIVAEKPTTLVVSGADRQRVGQVASEIRSYRGPEPYKGKGVKYEEETIVRKEGKKK
jgi:large subunit ribosomal protein L6